MKAFKIILSIGLALTAIYCSYVLNNYNLVLQDQAAVTGMMFITFISAYFTGAEKA
jgi:hypothetical protein